MSWCVRCGRSVITATAFVAGWDRTIEEREPACGRRAISGVDGGPSGQSVSNKAPTRSPRLDYEIAKSCRTIILTLMIRYRFVAAQSLGAIC